MLCLSGFEQYSRWVPLCYFEKQCCLIRSIKLSARGDVSYKLSKERSGTGCVLTKW